MKKLTAHKLEALQRGVVIPALPLVLTASRALDEERQRRLIAYYLQARVGGIAAAVHTTQFQIRDPQHNLFEPVLALTADVIDSSSQSESILKIAGVTGPIPQVLGEAETAEKLGYDIALLSTNGLGDQSEKELLDRARKVAEIMPIMGFYLQPAVGGRVLTEPFWCELSEIENLCAIKIAPFNRYQTLDVVRGVCSSSRHQEIALYTGNDDNILVDLLTTFEVLTTQGLVTKEIVGGLLGHWAVWAERAVALLETAHSWKNSNSKTINLELLTLAQKITDTNAAFFDAKNNYAGCIAGLHEVLRRQGLMEGIWCLDVDETLSPGQMDEINRIYGEYPELNDDAFVQDFLANYP